MKDELSKLPVLCVSKYFELVCGKKRHRRKNEDDNSEAEATKIKESKFDNKNNC